ncbi:hypothetical protein BJX70DRAFT_184650 [Aspergillus crustosus]
METHTTSSNPPQPPKQSAYTQSSNPVSQNPSESNQSFEQRTPTIGSYGTAPASITRGASSNPSTSQPQQKQPKPSSAQQTSTSSIEQDPEYGVEQQPTEGDIAHAVEANSRHRLQAGAHAGPIGSAQGPGAPAYGEEPDQLADLDRKTDEHFRILGERVGRTPPVEGDEAEREKLRERKLKEDRELHPGEAVGQVSGGGVVGR